MHSQIKLRAGISVLAISLALLVSSASAPAQNAASDNFDSGALDTSPGGWQVRNVCQLLGGYVNDSFVNNGDGKALRLQRGSFDASALGSQAYGTGRAWIFRTNDYSDFYVAMDLVNWNDATNQALVLLARGTGFDDIFNPALPIPGLAMVNGYVANYDNAQDGDTPGDRHGGQFQINRVTGESPSTIAACYVSLTVGHSYRTIFKGVGSTLTAQLYDLEDLTAPITTIVADDATYPSGKCGIVTFSRDDSIHPNRTDMTVDNYYSANADPNLDIAPAIRHPVTGTPHVTARVPSRRFTNFHPAATGITFSAKTYTTAQIDSAATRLYLNDIDFSSTLAPLPANGTAVTFTTAAKTLMPNHTYSVRVELQDTTGTLKSTHTFWFDTFTDAGIATAPFKTVECEDYNYSNGVYQLDPIPVSGYDTNFGFRVNGGGVGYFDEPATLGYTPVTLGTPEVDYHSATRTSIDNNWNDYRANDYMRTLQGTRQEIEDKNHPDTLPPFSGGYFRPNDGPRQKYATAMLPEFQVFKTSAGDWMNYTRAFTDTNYYVFLRCGGHYPQNLQLSLVTSDPTVTNQTTAPLGTFAVKSHLRWSNYDYEPLTVDGKPVVVHLAGTNTLRLTVNGVTTKDDWLVSLNYLLFVPTTGESPVLTLSAATGGSVTVSWPLIPFVLLSSPSLTSPQWTPVIDGITQAGNKNVYTVPAGTGSRYFKLVYP